MNGSPSTSHLRWERACWKCRHFRGTVGFAGTESRYPVCNPPGQFKPVMTNLFGCCDWTPAERPAMRVLVCGGRDYDDRLRFFTAMDRLLTLRDVTAVIHGAYRGADAMADEWAAERKIASEPFPADWKKYGSRAGPLRNARMLAEGRPDGVVAFPGGNGTEDMVAQAIAAGLNVWRPYG